MAHSRSESIESIHSRTQSIDDASTYRSETETETEIEDEEDEAEQEQEAFKTFQIDLKALPKGLFNLIRELNSDEPNIKILPRLSALDVAEFGDFFSAPTLKKEGKLKDEFWWQTRRAIFYLIVCCPTLTHIDLEGCGIHKEEEVQDLCLGLTNSRVLEVLNLGGNSGFGTEVGCMHLCRLVGKIPTLRELHLHDLDMKPDFLVYLTAALRRTQGCGLQTLDINFNPGLGNLGAEALALLIADPGDSSGIRHLRMFGTGMGTKGAYLLAVALKRNTSLESLYVGFETQDEDVQGPLSVLLSALVPDSSSDDETFRARDYNRSVWSLGVCGGREMGLANVLARILDCGKVRELNLSCSYFSSSEWQHIFRSLHDNTSLESLDMTHCEGLDATAYQEMMLMLESNESLTDIMLVELDPEITGKHQTNAGPQTTAAASPEISAPSISVRGKHVRSASE